MTPATHRSNITRSANKLGKKSNFCILTQSLFIPPAWWRSVITTPSISLRLVYNDVVLVNIVTFFCDSWENCCVGRWLAANAGSVARHFLHIGRYLCFRNNLLRYVRFRRTPAVGDASIRNWGEWHYTAGAQDEYNHGWRGNIGLLTFSRLYCDVSIIRWFVPCLRSLIYVIRRFVPRQAWLSVVSGTLSRTWVKLNRQQ